MKALVSGGAGFIGSHLVDALVERGDEVVVVDDLSTGRGTNIAGALARGAQLVPTDVTDLAAVERIVSHARPDIVFHLAAQVDVRKSVEDPGLDVRVNVEGTVNVLEATRRVGCERFVFASSCACYGEPAVADLPLDERSPLRPGSPYGQSKLAAEGYVALYRELHGFRAANLRFGNVYGPRQGGVGEAGVVSIFCGQLLAGATPAIYGTGEQTRDFVYVADVVRAMLAAADRGVGGEYNVGTSVETSILDLAGSLAAIAGRTDFAPELKPPRPGEVQRMALDPALAAAHLDWRPQVGLQQGLEMTWEAHARRRHAPERDAHAIAEEGEQHTAPAG